jgi:hypothetical protein
MKEISCRSILAPLRALNPFLPPHAERGAAAEGQTAALPEIFLVSLETKSDFSNFQVAIAKVAAGAPFGPGVETGTGRVRCRS